MAHASITGNSESRRYPSANILLKLIKDYANKMSVSLLKLELLFSESTLDADQVYLGKLEQINRTATNPSL